MMLDKIYLLAYLFIIIALGRVVATSGLAMTRRPKSRSRARTASSP